MPTTLLLSPRNGPPTDKLVHDKPNDLFLSQGYALADLWVPYYQLVKSFSPIADDFVTMLANALQLQPSRVCVSSHRPQAVASHAHTCLHVPGLIVSVAVDSPLEDRQ